MGPIPAQFEVVKASDNEYDVLVFSELAVLKAFASNYTNSIFIERSKFADKPMIVMPGFESNLHARTWVGYWDKTFANPEEACQSCNIVQDFFRSIEAFRQKQLVDDEEGPQS